MVTLGVLFTGFFAPLRMTILSVTSRKKLVVRRAAWIGRVYKALADPHVTFCGEDEHWSE